MMQILNIFVLIIVMVSARAGEVLSRSDLAKIEASLPHFNNQSLLSTIDSAEKYIQTIREDLSSGDERIKLIEFILDNLKEGRAMISNAINSDPKLQTEKFPKSKKIIRAIENILGAAYLNYQADQLLASTPLFDNNSSEMVVKLNILKTNLEGLRDRYFGNNPASVSLYRKIAYVRFSLGALNEIRDLANEALETKPEMRTPIRYAVENLKAIVIQLIRKRDDKGVNYAFEMSNAKRAFVSSRDWKVLKDNLSNLELGESSDIEGNYRAVTTTQFYFELLRNMWEVQL